MAILTKGTVLTLPVDIQVMDMISVDDTIYYLARFISRGKEGVVAADLTDIPLIILCTDSSVSVIPPSVAEFAKEFVARKYSGEDGPEDPSKD